VGAWTQVSRLGMPLVNEVVIGLPVKDRFNSSKPKDDAQFGIYVTNPTFPRLLEIAFGQQAGAFAPSNIPRTDLVAAFLTGNQGREPAANVVPSEMLRLNTSIPAVPEAQQERWASSATSSPAATTTPAFRTAAGRRDDIVDITLVAAMGGLCMANGDTNALQLGAACKPSAVPLARRRSSCMTASIRRLIPLLPSSRT